LIFANKSGGYEMLNRRRGERVELEEILELTLKTDTLIHNGPFIVDETSYEFGRKHGAHLNLLLTGLRFAGNINLESGQMISFTITNESEIQTGRIVWKKVISESEFMYGVKVQTELNRRRDDRYLVEEKSTLTVIEPFELTNYVLSIEEISYGLGRKHGVHLSPKVTGLRIKCNAIHLENGQQLTFQMPNEQELYSGIIVRKETFDNDWMLYGLSIN
jgi:antitoxin component of MazEF toxin-antitoxin module